ncbi:MAG: transposase family protein [Rubrobacter sp.]|nr:transposase family protein [Rubrobacter sp.]
MSDARTVFLPASKLLDLISFELTKRHHPIRENLRAATAPCAVCGKQSGRVHSRYTRTLADLPWQGVAVTVRVRVRRFFCDQRACDRAIFAEPLFDIATRYACRT